MVRDMLSNAPLYHALSPALARALRFLAGPEVRGLVPGQRRDLGGGMHATLHELEARPRDAGFWEAHRQYIDVQYLESGLELMGHAPLVSLRVGAYDEARDFVPAEGDGDFFRMSPGSFVIFWPGDAHMPGLAAGAPAPLRKVVVKVPVEPA